MKEHSIFYKSIVLICIISFAIIVVSFVFVFLYKSFNSTLNIKVDIGLLLSIILALFSIGLSLAFYFKTNETSDNYFKHSYDLMKDQSILLGRIEERFGEKLGSVQAALASLISANDRLDVIVGKDEKITEYLKSNDTKVDPIVFKKLLDERNQAVAHFNEVVDSLGSMRNEIENLKNNSLSKEEKSRRDYDNTMKIVNDIINRIPDIAINVTTGVIDPKFISMTDYFNGKKYGLFDENGKLTPTGLNLINGRPNKGKE